MGIYMCRSLNASFKFRKVGFQSVPSPELEYPQEERFREIISPGSAGLAALLAQENGRRSSSLCAKSTALP